MKKISTIQVLRLICFVFVLLVHSGFFNLVFLSELAVQIFFILSGFVLVYRNRDVVFKTTLKDLFIFLKKTISKLFLPNILVCSAILAIEIYSYIINNSEYTIAEILRYYFMQICLIQSFIPGLRHIDFLNGPSWYLSSMVLLYFVFPIISNRIRKISNKHIPLTIFVIYIIKVILSLIVIKNNIIPFMAHDDSIKYLLYYSPYFRIFDFLIGALIGRLYLNNKDKIEKNKTVLFLLSLFLLVINIVMNNKISNEWLRLSIQIIPLSCFIILLCVSFDYSINAECKFYKSLVRLGDLSGLMYISHAMFSEYIKNVYIHFIHVQIDKNLLFISVFICSAIFAIAWDYAKKSNKKRIIGHEL